MDLEKYKKSWENQPVETNAVSNIDVYKMSHSKSSSVVKWILIVGILELIFWTSLTFLIPQKYMEVYKDFKLMELLKATTYVHYVVIFVFLILFYRNYNSISITDSTKRLMNKILSVRKTVRYYVYYNLGTIIVSNIVLMFILLGQPDVLTKVMNPNGLNIETNTVITIFIVTSAILVVITFTIIWLFYKFTYGRLLKKLHENYKELDHLEHLN
ncbi:hypothetical protein KCTC32516_02209 [Polaribacter huanghezhanensis]|uniref:hypothetical protein n=1 Tax=Polaribacter huanghezhanensis TaxID=1354726 RepID=UPI0026479222|nr:hypothetical protein [Polaribacter huanghezhanensis]WKD86829.1 hypothetical protein KCTC32516_02209 [Polaribacter huanghezhanensis]